MLGRICLSSGIICIGLGLVCIFFRLLGVGLGVFGSVLGGRFRMSRQSVAKLAKRQVLRTAFLTDFEEELGALGWTMFEMADGSYAFLETASVEGWTKISSSRVAKEVAKAARNELLEDELEELLDLPDDSDDVEDQE